MRVHSNLYPLMFAALCAARPAIAQAPKAVDVNPDAEIGARLGQPVPDFTLRTFTGTQVSISTLKGRPVIINFWASWCPPCRQEMPLLIAVYEAHREAGLEVVAVNLTDQEYSKDIRNFVAEFRMPFTIALDAKGKTWSRYGLIALPTTVFVGSDGIVRVVNSGPISKATLDRDLAQILPPH